MHVYSAGNIALLTLMLALGGEYPRLWWYVHLGLSQLMLWAVITHLVSSRSEWREKPSAFPLSAWEAVAYAVGVPAVAASVSVAAAGLWWLIADPVTVVGGLCAATGVVLVVGF